MNIIIPAEKAHLVAESMTEDQLQEHVSRLLRKYGLTAQHIHDSRRSWLPGWPDLVILGNGKVLYRELKKEDGRVSREQAVVGRVIQRAGGDYAVWRPSDLLCGIVEKQLQELA